MNFNTSLAIISTVILGIKALPLNNLSPSFVFHLPSYYPLTFSNNQTNWGLLDNDQPIVTIIISITMVPSPPSSAEMAETKSIGQGMLHPADAEYVASRSKQNHHKPSQTSVCRQAYDLSPPQMAPQNPALQHLVQEPVAHKQFKTEGNGKLRNDNNNVGHQSLNPKPHTSYKDRSNYTPILYPVGNRGNQEVYPGGFVPVNTAYANPMTEQACRQLPTTLPFRSYPYNVYGLTCPNIRVDPTTIPTRSPVLNNPQVLD